VKKVGDYKYEVYGKAEVVNPTTIEISELPIYKWTNEFKAELEALCGEKGDGVLKACRTQTSLQRLTDDCYYRTIKNIRRLRPFLSR